MSYIQKLKSLENQKQRIESQIAGLEQLSNKCNQEIKAETSLAQRTQLNTQMDNYSTEINELYNKLDHIENEIENLKLKEKSLSSNDYLDNPKNQQLLKFEQYLYDIDFEKALKTFQRITSQFNKEGDVALFFIEKCLTNRGDLCLKRLKDDLFSETYNIHRQHFPPCFVTYTLGNLERVIQGIAKFFDVKKEEMTVELVINKIGNSLQNNSVLFIEINCDISQPSDIDPLIPWFINVFWKPLREKVNEVAKDYEGIKVVAVITSNLLLNSRFSNSELSSYYNRKSRIFSRDKLVKIPLEKWKKEDIKKWLTKYGNPRLKNTDKDTIAEKIYNATDKGRPTDVCLALQQKQWQNLIYSNPTY
ncbi:MAG: hypothetical protein O4807_07455 [Trichodesmium sp. St19_bin2]|nr:hypothetical protein [Trichodesmium sp. St19_bin2]